MALTEKYVSSAGAGAHDGSSEANAFSWTEMFTDINAGSKAGNRYNVKGNVNRGAADTITAGGSTTSPVIIRGYSSTIGDAYLGRTNTNGPLITTNYPVVDYASTFSLTASGASNIIIEGLKITGTRSGVLVSPPADGAMTRCVVENASTNGSAIAITPSGVRTVLFNCDASLTGGSGGSTAISASGTGVKVICCRVSGGPIGISIASTTAHAIDNVIFNCGIGIATSVTGYAGVIYGNTLVDTTGDGIEIVTGTTSMVALINNLLTDNGGYNLDVVSAANAVFAANNRLDRGTSGAINLGTDWITATSYNHNTTSATKANEYEDAATRDYRLKTGSPAKAAGMFAFRDIGALQREEAGGGSSSVKFHPGMVGGFSG